MLAAQLQGLGHERVIRAHGRLDFDDGSSLSLADRSVLRLSITLLDHAGLHDRVLMTMLLRTMLNMEFEAIPDAAKQVRDQVAKLNKVLRKGDMDMRVLDDHGVGESALLRGGSMSAGLLARVLADVMSERSPAPLKSFAELLAPLNTYGLLNPFAEYLLGRNSRSEG
jgi:hypothetical protein